AADDEHIIVIHRPLAPLPARPCRRNRLLHCTNLAEETRVSDVRSRELRPSGPTPPCQSTQSLYKRRQSAGLSWGLNGGLRHFPRAWCIAKPKGLPPPVSPLSTVSTCADLLPEMPVAFEGSEKSQ